MKMDESAQSKLNEYRQAVKALYQRVSDWVKDGSLIPAEKEICLDEEAVGPYKISELSLSPANGKPIARLRPAGAWVVAAKGLVELVGDLDKIPLIYADPESTPPQIFKGIERSGWYWVEDKRRGKAHLLDKSIFTDLLAEVSDYEF